MKKVSDNKLFLMSLVITGAIVLVLHLTTDTISRIRNIDFGTVLLICMVFFLLMIILTILRKTLGDKDEQKALKKESAKQFEKVDKLLNSTAEAEKPKESEAQDPGEPVKCPKCQAEQISADKKGFGAGKAVAGLAVAGPVGLAAGAIGAKKVRVTCLKCGNQWEAGKDK